ncbi:hypothetical protein [Microbispora rosea]|uniref:hypothetical protein n=1 Tax=Microbispora rosea TaxID=58117 RepID=UPI0012DDB20C|nr:hypothetical protein [Microbispora rosea]
MRMNPPAGDVTLDPGRGMAWVDEHGAHLVDYASGHLESGPMLAAVIAALESCAARERPGNVSDRAWLLSALRREVATGPGRGFLPGPGTGGPDHLAVRRAWRLADPLGAETLLLLYRHELPLRDLVYVLALPLKEAGRLIARTQDVVEILVSGLDGLARGRPICPEIAPLAAAVFPDEHGEAADFGAARTALLRHIVTCVVCKRPINIRYTVPQILSRPPVADLTAETRQRLLDALGRARHRARLAPPSPPQAAPVSPPRSAPASPSLSPPVSAPASPPVSAPAPPPQAAPAERAGHRPPSSFGMPLSAPVDTAPAPAPAPAVAPATASAPAVPAPASPAAPPPAPPSMPAASGLSPVGFREESRPPSREDRGDRESKGDREGRGDREHTRPGPMVPPAQPEAPRPTGTAPDAGAEPPERPVRAISQEDTQPSLPWSPGTLKSRAAQRPNPFPGAARGTHPASGEGPALPPGQDTPLYNALLSQIRAREALAHAAEAVPAPAPAPAPALVHVADAAHTAGEVELARRPPAGAQIRIVQVLARVGTLLRATALRIVIVVVAGAAGTVTGINLFAPAPQSQRGSLEASAVQPSADPAETGTGANPAATGGTDGAAAGGTDGAAAGGTTTGGTTSTAPGTPQVTVTATAAGGGTAGGAAQPGGQSTAAGGTAQPGGQQGTAAGGATGEGATRSGGQGAAPDTPASRGAFLMGAWGVQAPSVVTLDAFGRGTLTLSTTSGKPVKWRISAPGLMVEPSSGTLKPGHTDVLTVRALRVRYWCGVPSPVTAPLELHGPKGKGTATVRWSTC